MKRSSAIFFVSSLLLSTASLADLKASEPAKVYIGDNGEKVETVVVNDSKEIVAHLVGVGAPWEGKTFTWTLKDKGDGDKAATYKVKRGSKTEDHNAMLFSGGGWTLYPQGTNKEISVYYSKGDSEKVKAADILKMATSSSSN